jgi:hypothetical protein
MGAEGERGAATKPRDSRGTGGTIAALVPISTGGANPLDWARVLKNNWNIRSLDSGLLFDNTGANQDRPDC